MSLIWLLFVLILLIVLSLLIMPIIRAQNNQVTVRQSYNVAIYKDQLKEADREFERGLLSPQQLDTVKTEIDLGSACLLTASFVASSVTSLIALSRLILSLSKTTLDTWPLT